MVKIIAYFSYDQSRQEKTWHPIETDGAFVHNRLRELIFYRVLQLDRHINVETALKAVGGTDKLRQSLAGMVSNRNKDGSIVNNGQVGMDRNGYPFKDWIVGNQSTIIDRLKGLRIERFHPDTLEAIRKRSNVDSSG